MNAQITELTFFVQMLRNDCANVQCVAREWAGVCEA